MLHPPQRRTRARLVLLQDEYPEKNGIVGSKFRGVTPSICSDLHLGLQVGPDPRLYMRQVYDAVSAGTSGEVAAATAADGASGPDAFYLALYRGLLLEALGDARGAAAAVAASRGTEYARRYGSKDYMIALADVHCAQRGSCS